MEFCFSLLWQCWPGTQSGSGWPCTGSPRFEVILIQDLGYKHFIKDNSCTFLHRHFPHNMVKSLVWIWAIFFCKENWNFLKEAVKNWEPPDFTSCSGLAYMYWICSSWDSRWVGLFGCCQVTVIFFSQSLSNHNRVFICLFFFCLNYLLTVLVAQLADRCTVDSVICGSWKNESMYRPYQSEALRHYEIYSYIKQAIRLILRET